MYICFFGLLVSFDAFVCGLTLGNNKRKHTALLAFYSGIISFVGSYIFSQFGRFINMYIDMKTAGVYAGLILISISLFSFLESAEIIKFNKRKASLSIKLASCSVVAVDASFAALSLSLSGNNRYVYTAVVFGIMHAIMIFSGGLISQSKVFKLLLKRMDFLPMIIMFLLGLFKIISAN